ncbi:hypothetical protein HS141_11170 [Cetobacterium somerae]|uniref:hypothetical protein n=1 Tax=Cetobacterium somerae TaxID=188913 RepID=UPI00211DA680|nr:hypothetical protein [Cetobacterium somerae]MCQ9627493.1 hypothetical protein [Cetobacterium somerae]
MKKILIKVINCTLHYDGKEHKPDETVEIEERFFRSDCMEKINEITLQNDESQRDEIQPKESTLITIKELKEISQNKYEIALTKTKKDEVFKEAKEKFAEKGLDLEVEIEKYLAEKNTAGTEDENSEGTN